jgi:hypothetical protein
MNRRPRFRAEPARRARALARSFVRLLARVLARLPVPEARDLTFVVGLLVLGAGLWQIYRPLAFVADGALLVYVALWLTPAPAPPTRVGRS